MSAYIFDIDGTLVKYHTNIWLEGAKEMLIKLCREGHQIILITMRDFKRDEFKEWSPQRTMETILNEMDNEKIKFHVLWNVNSPRILCDDSHVELEKRKTNQSWIK